MTVGDETKGNVEMAFTIEYGGDETDILRKVLSDLAGREVYVEITCYPTCRKEDFAGNVYRVDADTNEVLLDEVDNDTYSTLPDGKTFTIDVDDIAKLVVP